MKIAIIGAGFAGLATAWHLLQDSADVTIFDPLGPGGKASGIAAGLLHPFSGLHAKLNRFGLEGYEEALRLLEASEKALQTPVYSSSPLLRVALNASQEADYLKCSLTEEAVDFLKAEECQKLIPSLTFHPGILIKKAKVVDAKPYLQGLALACQNLKAKFEKTKIQDVEELKEFTHIVVTAGADLASFKECASLSLSLIKGQLLELEWPTDLAPLPVALNSSAYLIMSQDQKSCFAGATFEKDYIDGRIDQKKAESEIMPKIEALIPRLKTAKIIGCKAAFRVASKNHLPLIQKLTPRLFVFTGLGSKGLLYHGLYAKKLASTIIKNF